MTTLRSLGLPLMALLLWTLPAWSQTTVEVHPGSSFWIEGRSSVNSFSCQVDSIAGTAQLATTRPASLSDTTRSTVRPEADLEVPVKTFDCGKRRMTEDLKETLQAKAYPVIWYTLHRAEIVDANSTAGHRIRARGTLTIAGTERTIELVARGQRIGPGQFRLCGSRTLQMSDFGIDPPTKFFGLIRVEDEIEAHFDLIATTTTDTAAPTLAAQDTTFDPSNRLCSL